MAEVKATCLLCGKEYRVCKLCSATKRYTPWKIDFDDPRHFKIYAVVRDIREGTITAEEAKEMLDQLKVTVKEVKSFVPSVRQTLAPIMGISEVTAVEPKKMATEEEKKSFRFKK